MKWHGKRAIQGIEDEMRRRMNSAAARTASYTRRMISESTRANGASEPGEYPHADTGRLRNSVTHDVERGTNGEIIGRVGSNVEYAEYLERGTRKMAARPFLLRAVLEMKDEIRRILGRPFGRGKK